MTQLQEAPRRAPVLTTGIVAMVAVAVIAATIVLGMLIPGRVSMPATGGEEAQVQTNPLLVDAEREWQRQREQQGGFTDPLTQAGRDWESQRRQQSPFDGE